jgi:hypothetical protein
MDSLVESCPIRKYPELENGVYGVERNALKFNSKYFDEDLMVFFTPLTRIESYTTLIGSLWVIVVMGFIT